LRELIGSNGGGACEFFGEDFDKEAGVGGCVVVVVVGGGCDGDGEGGYGGGAVGRGVVGIVRRRGVAVGWGDVFVGCEGFYS
jgi:hypothetical protein